MGKLFGTDGVRGVANQPPMTVDMLVRLARAATYALGARQLLIGKDTRLSGYMIETALASGICSMGANALLVGPMPTPGIAFLTSDMRADAGVVISASHNPYQDNGVKFFSRDGYKLSDALENKIEELVFNDSIDSHLPTAENVGKAFRISDAKGRYIVFLKEAFPKQFTLEGIKIVLDCANGAAYKIAPSVLEELGAKVITMNTSPDGKNINADCGATQPQKMCRRVVQECADIGVALDGDGDRAIFSDEKGNVVDGDQVLAIIAKHLHEKGQLPNNGMVATVMSNYGLSVAMKKLGVDLVQSDVGDRYVVELMRAKGYKLGGEQSGHVVFLDHTTTGDGIVTALKLLAVMVETKKPVSSLKTVMEQYPQTLVNVRVKEKKPFSQVAEVQRAIDQVVQALGDRGRILVRYSGTENLARVMVEGENETVTKKYANEIADVIRRAIGA